MSEECIECGNAASEEIDGFWYCSECIEELHLDQSIE